MRPTQKRMRDGKVNHLQNTYTNQKILLRQELFPTEWHPTCHRHQIAPISHDIGTEQQTQLEQQTQEKKNSQEHEIKHNTSTPYKSIKLHKQTNKSTGTPSSTKTRHYTLDSHNQKQWQTWLLILKKQTTTHTRQSRIPFLQTSLTHIPSPTFLIREVLTVSKKKKTSGVNQESITTGKEREKGKKSGSWGSKNKNFFSTFRTFEWIRTQRIFFFSLTKIFSLSHPFEHDGRQFNFGFSTFDQNDIRHRSDYPG